jgi:hypothetical protein
LRPSQASFTRETKLPWLPLQPNAKIKETKPNLHKILTVHLQVVRIIAHKRFTALSNLCKIFGTIRQRKVTETEQVTEPGPLAGLSLILSGSILKNSRSIPFVFVCYGLYATVCMLRFVGYGL